MVEPFREPFVVHTYGTDAFLTLATPALTGFLMEAAGLHAQALNVGVEGLWARGLSWVIGRLRLELDRPIRLGETLEIETWPSGIDRLAALRDFRVTAGGEEVARASTQWFVLDLTTRRPVKLEGVLDPRFPRDGAHAVAFTPGKLPELATWDFQKRFHIRYADMDVNGHVNNGSYLAWALEAVPREVWAGLRLSALEVQYLAECREGSAILSRQSLTGEAAYAHAIVREEDGKELARATTRWVKR
ncbi:MAG: thioesterase [Anaeromyxobacter sp.]